MPKSNEKRTKNKGQNRQAIYLDHASSALFSSPNTSAIHALGLAEKNKLENARKIVAKVLDAHSDEIIFTSGATESNNLAIQGVVNAILGLTPSPLSLSRRGVGERWVPHIVTTNIEHASVLETCRHLERVGRAEVTYVEVEKNGIVDPKKIKKALKSNTVLVSVMYVNNEIGTIQPIKEIAKEIRHWRKNLTPSPLSLLRRGVGERCIFPFVHTDATQAVNYLSLNVEQLGVDLMSFNGTKIYGPKGVGVLFKRRNVNLSPIMWGGDQEFGLRPGTENSKGIVDLAKALEATEKIKEKEVKRLIVLRDYFINKLLKLKNIDQDFNFLVNGDQKNRLPNNINITIPNIPSDLLVIELSAKRVMASAKSACKSGDGKASHVISAINKDTKETDGSLRFSLGKETTKADIDYTGKALVGILSKLKKWYN